VVQNVNEISPLNQFLGHFFTTPPPLERRGRNMESKHKNPSENTYFVLGLYSMVEILILSTLEIDLGSEPERTILGKSNRRCPYGGNWRWRLDISTWWQFLCDLKL
jgi:hypothetical protein